MESKHLVVLFGYGGLSDVGRHAILAGLERSIEEIQHITVITKYSELLDESNWNCGCEDQPHNIVTENNDRVTIIKIDKETNWDTIDLSNYLVRKTDNNTTLQTIIVSCLGNRQPFIGHWDSATSNNALIRAIQKVYNTNNTNTNDNQPQKEITTTTTTTTTTKQLLPIRVIVLSSVGLNEDWPALEFFTIGRIAMFLIYKVFARTMYNDLLSMEQYYKDSATTSNNNSNIINYLLVRPVGMTEDIVPVNNWIIQTEKFKHVLGIEMAKMDIARYMVSEAITPTTIPNTSVVIGSDPTIPLKRIVPPKK